MKRKACREKWICTCCGLAVHKTDDSLLNEITELLNGVIDYPKQIEIPKRTQLPVGNSVAENALNFAREWLVEQVSARYDKIDFSPLLARKMRDIFEGQKVQDCFSRKLFADTVERVRLNAEGKIILVLKNRQEIGG